MNFSETKSKNFLNILLSSIFAKEVSVYPPIKQNANGAGPPNLHYATRKFQKKKWGKHGKSRILIARLHFSMVILWRQLHIDFLRFVKLGDTDAGMYS